MSRWFDILYRKTDISPPPTFESQGSADGLGVAPVADTSIAAGSPEAPRKDVALAPVPTLHSLPDRWEMEAQKIAFHLAGNHCVMFSSLYPGSGTTTAIYLVAHYVASEHPGQRVLYVDFSGGQRRPPARGAHAVVTVGDTIDADFFFNIPQSLTRISIRGQDSRSVAATAVWLKQFMQTAKEIYEFVFADFPPFSRTPECYSVAKLCDGVVFVLRAGEVRYPALNAQVFDLEQLGIKVLGTVLNFRRFPIPRWLLKFI